jgi:hypothetical protein
MPALGQPRRSDEVSGMSALPLIATECGTAAAGAGPEIDPLRPHPAAAEA